MKHQVDGNEPNGDAGSYAGDYNAPKNQEQQERSQNDSSKVDENHVKRTLCKQPSNGIHVLKPDSLLPTNGLPPYSGDVDTSAAHTNQKDDAEISFDPKGSYYMANACCELVHYRVAAILVGVVELVLIAGWAAAMYFYYDSGELHKMGSKISISVQGVAAAAYLCLIILMFIGILAERPLLLWPHMIVQIGGISLGIGFTVIAVIAMCAGTTLAETIFSGIFGEEKLPMIENMLGPIWPFCLAVVFDFGAALGIWFYIVVKGCYEYLMDKVFFEKYYINNPRELPLKKEKLGISLKKAS